MIINWIVRLVVVAVLWLLSFHMTSAQSEEMLYVVSGSTSINARQCPRLDCAVVEALQPGTEVTVIEMVNGDTVFGSDQWAQLENGSGEVYVHSALIDPVAAGESDAGGKVVSDMDQRDESAAPAREAESRETVEAAPLDTSHWLVVEVDRFTVRMPPMWEDIQELAADEDFLDDVERMFGESERQWYLDTSQACEDGTFDVVYTEFGTSASLRISHEDLNGFEFTPNYMRRVLMTGVTSSGGEVVSAEVVTLPAGEAVRVEGRYRDTTTSPTTVFQEITYALFTGDEIYTLDLWVASSYDGDYGPVIDAIATSFHQDASNL